MVHLKRDFGGDHHGYCRSGCGTAEVTADQMVARVREFEAAGMDRKAAIATVADEFDLPKRIVYAAVVDANKMRS